jgi:SAM-dependent methyltransferase
MTDGHPWEQQAGNWLAWARTPGHDVFPYFAPQFFEEIVPPPSGRTLEMGCGEGRVMRELAQRGHAALGIDASPTLVGHARAAAPALGAPPAYLTGDATKLPFADATFDTVITYNSLQTMTLATDMATAVSEAARVLKPSGTLCACIAHPMSDVLLVGSVEIEGGRLSGSYFENHRVEETVTQNGLPMTFYGWTYTLEDYTRALDEAGFAIDLLREPTPSAATAGEPASLERWRRMPLFLFIRAVKR